MIDLIKEIFTSPAGSFGFVFGILVLAFWLVHYVTKKITIINAKHDELSDDCKDLEMRNMKALEKSEESISKRFETIGAKIDDIRKDIAYLRGFTESIQKTVNDGYTQKHSPVSLTNKGLAEVKESGLDKIVDKNWIKICKTLDDETMSKNPYDIQTYCMENVFVSPDKFFEDDDVYYIKKLAFSKGLALMTYTNMLAVLIRDRYFKQKGIDVREVDQYDPSSTSPKDDIQ